MKATRRRKRPREMWDCPRRIPTGDLVAFDTETTGINYWQGDAPFAFSWCNDVGETGYIEWDVDPYTRTVIPDEREADLIREWASDSSVTKVMHNGKFDRNMCSELLGVEWSGEIIDTMLAAHVCDSMEPSYGLKPLTVKHCGVDNDDEKELKRMTERARKFGKQHGWCLTMSEKMGEKQIAEGKVETYRRNIGKSSVPPDYWMVSRAFPEHAYLVRKYAVLDAYRTMMLWYLYRDIMDDDASGRYWETFRMEQKLEPVVEQMERRGIAVDDGRLQSEYDACVDERDTALRFLEKVVDGHMFTDSKTGDDVPFSPSNDGHLRWLMYDRCGLPVKHRTKKTQIPSVSAPALMDHTNNETVRNLFQYNIADKGANGFFGTYQKLMVRDTVCDGWVLHPDFKQFEQKTGRFACRRPNLQNVPDAISTRSVRPIQGRMPFGPRPGYRWYLYDYSQLEVRIFADVSQEPTLLRALASGRDLHTECANKAWGGYDNATITPVGSTFPPGVRNGIDALGIRMTTLGGHDVVGSVDAMIDAQRSVGYIEGNDYTDRELQRMAFDWLKKFDFDIVAAEKSLGKKNTRAKAKMVLFARMFGGGPKAIRDLMGVTYDEAAGFMDDYNRAFPGIVQYIDARTAEAERDGGIYNRYGRWLVTPPDQAYKSVNYTVQGSAADLIKRAMVKVNAYLRSIDIDIHLVLTIHDELIFEAAHGASKRSVLRTIREIMEDHEGAFGIPTPVDAERSDVCWPEKYPVKWLTA